MKNLFIIFIIIISFLCSENYCYSATKTYSVVSIASNVKYDRYFIVSDGQKYGVASEYGKLTIPCEYPKIYRSKSGHLIVEKQENNQTTKALFNIKGEQITHFIECEDIDKICDIIIISKDGKFYKYNKDTNEEILLSEMKDSDNNPNDYIFILKNGGKYGIIECHKYVTPNNYYVILPFDYDEISDFYSRIYIISIGNKKALFNSWKKEFSTFYDDIKLKSNRCYNPTRIRVYVKENDKWHYLTDQYKNPNEDILKETLEHTVMIPIEVLFYFEIPARTPKKIKVKI